MELLLDILLDTAIDTIKLVPFLFLAYLAMEYLETKAGEKTISMLLHTGKKGPVIGGLLGILPQCGFSAAASNLYSGGVVTVGTLLAVYLSTSDEMLPILLSEQAPADKILKILAAKVIIGITAGILVDMAVRLLHGGNQRGLHIHELCERDHCHCEEGSILYSAFTHSLQITAFIFIISLALNGAVEVIGMETLVRTISSYPLISVFLTGLVGLIPNCASSVTITSLYLDGVLSTGSMLAGLLSCAGIGLVVLFRSNRHLKTNLMILGTLYGISVLCGTVIEFL